MTIRDEKLRQFLDDLQEIQRQDEEKLIDLCRRRIIHGLPHVFEGREDDYYEFRKRIANKFKVNFHEFSIVGLVD